MVEIQETETVQCVERIGPHPPVTSDSDGGVRGKEELADSEAGTPAGPSGEPGRLETLLIHPLAVVTTHGGNHNLKSAVAQ